MKTLIYLLLTISLLSSCGNKLYSYRKTVKVKYAVTKNREKESTPKIYMTIVEVKPEKKKTTTPVKKLSVRQNTVYNTTKPIELAKQEKSLTSAFHSPAVMPR